MKIESIPNRVVEAVRSRGFSDEEIAKMTARHLFKEHLEWDGLTGWGYDLYELAHRLAVTEKLAHLKARAQSGGD